MVTLLPAMLGKRRNTTRWVTDNLFKSRQNLGTRKNPVRREDILTGSGGGGKQETEEVSLPFSDVTQQLACHFLVCVDKHTLLAHVPLSIIMREGVFHSFKIWPGWPHAMTVKRRLN